MIQTKSHGCHSNWLLSPTTYDEPVPSPTAMTDFDRTVSHYYATRRGDPREESYTDLAIGAASTTPAKRGDLFKVLKHQGFFPES